MPPGFAFWGRHPARRGRAGPRLPPSRGGDRCAFPGDGTGEGGDRPGGNGAAEQAGGSAVATCETELSCILGFFSVTPPPP